MCTIDIVRWWCVSSTEANVPEDKPDLVSVAEGAYFAILPLQFPLQFGYFSLVLCVTGLYGHHLRRYNMDPKFVAASLTHHQRGEKIVSEKTSELKKA